MSRSGRPEPEVIANFNDGCSYNKAKLEEIYRNGLLERPAPKTTKDSVPLKKEDVELIVREFECSKAQAEKVLSQNDGKIEKALLAMINPSLVV